MNRKETHTDSDGPAMGSGFAGLLRDQLAQTPNVTVFDTVEECLDFALGHGYSVPLVWEHRIDGVCVGIRNPRCLYDPGEFRWYRPSPTGEVHHVFHIVDDAGRVYQLDPVSGSFRQTFRACGHHAYVEFLETIYTEDRRRLYQPDPMVRDIFDIYVPFYRTPSELQVRACANNEDDAFPEVPTYVDFRQVSHLIQQHATAGAEWLHSTLVEANRRTWTEAVRQLRRGSKGAIGSYAEAFLMAENETMLFRSCERTRQNLPDRAFLSPDTDSQYILINHDGITPFSSPFGVPESRWFEGACILKVRPPHSASFMALFLQSREGLELKLHIRMCLLKGYRSVLSKCHRVPPRPEQLKTWVQFAHDGEVLASGHRRLAEHALNPLACLTGRDPWRTVRSLHQGQSLLREGIAALPIELL